MGFLVEQYDNRGHCGWLMPTRGKHGARPVGLRAYAEVFPTRDEADQAIERRRPDFPAAQFHFKACSEDA